MKKCPVCGKEKTEAGFYIDNSKKDRLQFECINCRKVRKQNSRYNSYEVSVKHQRCSTCGLTKLASEFALNSGNKSGLYHNCRECKKEQDKKGYDSLRVRAKKFDVTVDYLEKLLENDTCEICGRKGSEFKRSLNIDHNHVTKKIRGVLCTNCNTAIGKLFVDEHGIDLLCSAISYLKNTEIEMSPKN